MTILLPETNIIEKDCLKTVFLKQRLCVLEGDTSSSEDRRTFVRVEPGLCHVITDHPMRFALIGQPRESGPAYKILQLATFVPVEPLSSECVLRIYFVQNTWDALEVCHFNYEYVS